MIYRPRLWFPLFFLLAALASVGVSIQEPAPFSPLAFAQPLPPPLNASVQGVGGPENIMILLDSSYSMGEKLGHNPGQRPETKMIEAKRSVLEVLDKVAPNTQVGLRVYGNSANMINSCHSTSLLVPLGQNNRNLMAAKLLGVRPTGSTPISYSIIQSLNDDFQGWPGKRSILLISDGIETCGEDPCNLAVRMQQLGANVKINVIGLGLQDFDAIKQLRCVALATKGQFYTANTAAELANSLTSAMSVQTNVQAQILPSSGTAPPAQGPPRTYQPIPSQSAMPQQVEYSATQNPQRVSHPSSPGAVQKQSGQYVDRLLPAAVPIKPRKR